MSTNIHCTPFICLSVILLYLFVVSLLSIICFSFPVRHMKGSPSLTKSRIGPRDYMSSTLGSDLGTTLLSEEDEEDDEEDEEEEDRYAAVSKALCGFDYTPAHSMEGLESTGTSGDG